jgi:hypothetical protein
MGEAKVSGTVFIHQLVKWFLTPSALRDGPASYGQAFAQRVTAQKKQRIPEP